ncbi:MAG: cation transporter, partial [Gammaproteobacteria bacterium]
MSEATITRLSVADRTCAGCVAAVENALKGVPGVSEATVNFAEHSAQVKGEVAGEVLVKAVRDAGYTAAVMAGDEDVAEAEAHEQAAYRNQLRKSFVAGLVGFPLLFGSWFDWFPPMSSGHVFWVVVGLVTLGVMAYSGGQYYRGAVKSWRHPNMDTLVALGTGAAWIYSMVVTLYPGVVPSLARY